MSRQRIRSSVLESSTEKCPHCGGTGHVRSVASVALQLLRSLEEMLLKGATHDLTVRTRSEVALYLLNYKRAHLRALEERFRITIVVSADPGIAGQISFLIERGDQVHSLEQAKALAAQALPAAPIAEEAEEESFEDEDAAPEFDDVTAVAPDEEPAELGDQGEHHDEDQDQGEGQEQGQGRKRRRRRRGRRGGEGRDDGAFQREPSAAPLSPEQPVNVGAGEGDAGGDFVERPVVDAVDATGADTPAESNGEGERRRRRRGRRGGRRNRHDREGEAAVAKADTFEPQLDRVAADLDVATDLDDAPAPMTDMQSPTDVSERQAELPANAEAPALEKSPAQTAESPGLSATTISEPARKRSTVREPAFASPRNEAAEPAPSGAPPPVSIEPVVSGSGESESSDRPRRSGWWSKRVLGKH
jgi:ribonuclease E